MSQRRAKMFCLATGLLAVGLVATYFVMRPSVPKGNGVDSKSPSALPEPTTDDVTALLTPRGGARVAEDRRRLDPRNDGWDTETLAETTKSQLGRVTKLLEPSPEASAGDIMLSEIVDEKFSAALLRPEKLHTVMQDAAIVVRRGEQGDRSVKTVHQGPAGLVEALRALAQPLRGCRDVHTHHKIIDVILTPTTAETTSYFEVSGHTDQTTVQLSAKWHARWSRAAGGPPRLLSLRAENYEEAIAQGPDGKWFADCTEAVLAHNDSYAKQLVYGHNHWLSRIERVHRMDESVRNGISVADVNGDGLDDVYVCQPPGLPNRLFIQNADGTATDRSAEYGVDWLDNTSSALLIDLDGDGDQDLVAALAVRVVLMENVEGRHFRQRAVLDANGFDKQSITAADYDSDGDLDLYVTVYRSDPGKRKGDFVFYDAKTGGENRLYRNDIFNSDSSKTEWQFTDVTEASGLGAGNNRYTWACAWQDYDDDGDADLYVANDFGPNYLFQNEGGKFREVAAEAGVVDYAAGMSVSWGDYNRDGRMDLYVGNMFSSAGSRITNLATFQQNADPQVRTLYRRLAKGNSLFENLGGGKFREVSREAGVEIGRWAWSSLFVDLNNDGWEDMLVANGYMTTEDTGDL
jgi:hypothetical protein